MPSLETRHPAPWTVGQGPFGSLMVRDARGHGFASLPAVRRDTPESLRVEAVAQRAADAAALASVPELVLALEQAKAALESIFRAPTLAAHGAGSSSMLVQDFNLRAARSALANAEAVLAAMES